MARREDLGDGDITCELLGAEIEATGRFVAREAMVFCGGVLLGDIAAGYDERIRTELKVEDGREVAGGRTLAAWRGPARAILSGERVALNFIQRLSGVATITRRYAGAIAGTGAEVFDTRKTTPGWRDLEKYAVRVGGGRNHRRGLYDAVLVKDNHLAVLAATGAKDPIAAVGRELDRIRAKLGEDGFVALEVDTQEQLDAALKLPVDIILLDNFLHEQLREAVARRDRRGLRGRVALEASGGITLDNVRKVAETGVERISVGALTHSPGAVDIAMDIELE